MPFVPKEHLLTNAASADTSPTPGKTAVCQLCNQRLERPRITKHLKSCLRRQLATGPASHQYSVSNAPAHGHRCHLRISTDFPNNLHYLHLLVRPDVTLRELDDFIRQAWTEPCCAASHASRFTKGDHQFTSNWPAHATGKPDATLRQLWSRDGSGPDYLYDPDLFIVCNLVEFGI